MGLHQTLQLSYLKPYLKTRDAFSFVQGTFISFRNVLKFSSHRLMIFIFKFIPIYLFIFYVAIVNGVFSSTIASNWLFFVNIKAIDFLLFYILLPN